MKDISQTISALTIGIIALALWPFLLCYKIIKILFSPKISNTKKLDTLQNFLPIIALCALFLFIAIIFK